MRSVMLIGLLALAAPAQVRRIVVAWTDTRNPPPVAYNVYRGTKCTSLSKLATVTGSKSMMDFNVKNNTTYCYQARAVVGTLESPPSNTATKKCCAR